MHDQPSPETPRSRAVAGASTILALSHLQSIAVQQGERAGRGRREPSPTRPQPAVRPARGWWRGPGPLLILLAVQAALSLRLIWANTAFLDEGTYVWAGRIELWNVLHGTGVPAYATYFSGAPVIYPPLAGLADFLGGLTGTRLMSLGFMLGATAALWGTTRRLYGQRAALSAVALFVFIGSTQYLGALATYDAMALFLLTLSAWLVVVARDHDDSSRLLLAAVAALAGANATKYATGVFDPVVIALAVALSPRGLKAGLGRAGLILTQVIGSIALLLALGGPDYLVGLESTTLARVAGASSPRLILADSVGWIGVVMLLACLGAAVGWWRRDRGWVLLILAAAGLLVPANQARIHTTVSLVKHVDFGAWFACVAGGYLLSQLSAPVRIPLARTRGREPRLVPSRIAWGLRPATRGLLALALAAAIVGPGGVAGRAQAAGFEDSWPNTSKLVPVLRSLAGQYRGTWLAEDQQVLGYYLEDQLPWRSWSDTWYLGYRAPGSDTCVQGSTSGLSMATWPASALGQALEQAIQHEAYGLIMLDYGDTPDVDQVITVAIHKFHTYHVVAQPPISDRFGNAKYVIWAPDPGKGQPRGSAC